MDRNYIIGIDFGTTHSSVGIAEGNDVTIIPIGGHDKLLNVVSFKDDCVLVGQSAESDLITNRYNTIHHIKQLIGRQYDDPVVQKLKSTASFTIEEGCGGKAFVKVNIKASDERFHPEEILAILFSKLKSAAESYLQHEVTEAVVTAPHGFTSAQRGAILLAGQIAQLSVREVISEALTHEVAYRGAPLDLECFSPQDYLILDVGSTLNITLFRPYDIVHMTSEVVMAVHREDIGEDLFIDNLVKYCVTEIKELYNIELMAKSLEITTLRHRVWEAIAVLVTKKSTLIHLQVRGEDIRLPITRTLFDTLNQASFQEVANLCKYVREKGGIYGAKLLVIGERKCFSSLIQLVAKTAECKGVLWREDNVIRGAAMQASWINSLRTGPYLETSIGIRQDGSDLTTRLLPKNTPLPVTKLGGSYHFLSLDIGDVTILLCEADVLAEESPRILGRVEFKGPTQSERSQVTIGLLHAKIDVKVNVSGIITVSIFLVSSGRRGTVTASLSPSGPCWMYTHRFRMRGELLGLHRETHKETAVGMFSFHNNNILACGPVDHFRSGIRKQLMEECEILRDLI